MEGFIPVSKESLLTMLQDCRAELDNQVKTKTQVRVNKYITNEKERISTRRWYRLFMLPKARFAFNEASVISYADGLKYPIFESSPFFSLNEDARHSLFWIQQLENVAQSQHSGEPIQLDIKTFMRISQPEQYNWATVGICYSIIY